MKRSQTANRRPPLSRFNNVLSLRLDQDRRGFPVGWSAGNSMGSVCRTLTTGSSEEGASCRGLSTDSSSGVPPSPINSYARSSSFSRRCWSPGSGSLSSSHVSVGASVLAVPGPVLLLSPVEAESARVRPFRRWLRRNSNAPAMIARSTATPTPTPIPALSTVDKPVLSLTGKRAGVEVALADPMLLRAVTDTPIGLGLNVELSVSFARPISRPFSSKKKPALSMQQVLLSSQQ